MTTGDVVRHAGVRECRPCTACCIQLPISAGKVCEAAKPAGTPCPKLGSFGCADYSGRPRLCVEFSCVWLADRCWPEAWRPDRCGLLCLREEIEEGVPAAAVYECAAGALDQLEASEILEQLKRTTAVVVLVDKEEHRWRVSGHLSWHPQDAVVRRPHFCLGAALHDSSAGPSQRPLLGS